MSSVLTRRVLLAVALTVTVLSVAASPALAVDGDATGVGSGTGSGLGGIVDGNASSDGADSATESSEILGSDDSSGSDSAGTDDATAGIVEAGSELSGTDVSTADGSGTSDLGRAAREATSLAVEEVGDDPPPVPLPLDDSAVDASAVDAGDGDTLDAVTGPAAPAATTVDATAAGLHDSTTLGVDSAIGDVGVDSTVGDVGLGTGGLVDLSSDRSTSRDAVLDAAGSERATTAADRASGQQIDLDRPRGTAPAGSGPVPGGPETGVALGLGALAVAAVARGSPAVAGPLGDVAGSAVLAGGVFAPPPTGRSAALDRLGRLGRLFAPLRYSRYDDSDPLEHDARRSVYDLVSDSPGAYLTELSEAAGLPLSTTRHHVRVLEREDLVTGAKVRGKRRFYPAYTEGIELAAAMNDDATASILDALSRVGAASVSDIADEVERDPSTVSHHLSRLEADGIVARERDGRAVINRLAPEAREALEPEAAEAASPVGEPVAGSAD